MDDGQEAERLRIEDENYEGEIGRMLEPGEAGTICIVAQTKAIASYPTTAAVFYGCTTADVFGDEVEGGPGSVTPESDTFLALNLGSAVPPVGTSVIAAWVENRWCFRYDG